LGLPSRYPVPQIESIKFRQVTPSIDQIWIWVKLYCQENPEQIFSKALDVSLQKNLLWNQAIPFLEKEQWKRAKQFLDKILILDEHDSLIHFNMGAITRNLGNFEQSLIHYQKSENIFNDERTFYTNRARTYEALGEKEKAILDYKKALELMSSDAFTLDSLVRLKELVELYQDPKDPHSKILVKIEDYVDSVKS